MNDTGSHDIVLNGFTKSYRSDDGVVSVFLNQRINIGQGEVVSFVGPNGSGKSTLLRLVLGLEESDSIISASTPAGKRSFAYLPQDYRSSWFPWFDLEEHITLWLTKRERERFEEYCAEIKLHVSPDRYPYQLSGGQQQLFLFGLANSRDCRVLGLDEGLSAVDSGNRKSAISSLLQWSQNYNRTTVCVSHFLDEAVAIADRVIVLVPGKQTSLHEFHIGLPRPRSMNVTETPEGAAILASIRNTVSHASVP
ncbi:MAG: ABC transporter ATP-binding protein [Bdellovibrionales bacterium]|nr:ABC transporter ATP-binding protein [Bdellovibrionales bacterium]